MVRPLFLAIASALAAGCARAAPWPGATDIPVRDTSLRKLDVAASGAGAAIYRIPALAVSTRGTILAAFDARPTSADLPSHIKVVLRRSTDDGTSFGAPVVVRQGPPPEGYGDPSLLVDRITGRIFLFYSATVNQGFAGSRRGADEHDPEIQQTDYSYSDDDGLTWRHRRITAAIKNSDWGGMFASSGQGIQLRRGPLAGRLVQQYVVRHDGANWAVSAWSDDHGATWQAGTPVGPGADENKVVELADGRLMLNSRARPYRAVAYSADGGATWSDLRPDSALVDPGNNGSIIRVAPAAASDGALAHWLLLSNTADSTNRRNLTVRLSCDDGRTWPVRRTVEAAASAYSTLARLASGRFGLLYERDDYRYVTLATFELGWVGQSC